MRLSVFCIVLVQVGASYFVTAQLTNNVSQEDPAVTNLRSYLRIQSAHPTPDKGYGEAVEWLKERAEELQLDFHLINFTTPEKFALWMTWNGSDPSLKSILLNSHMDVVAVEPDKWQHPPFEAFKDAQGNIYGRGAVDMKSATVAELEAIRKLKSSGFQPLRTIHLAVLPDEEEGGQLGMIPFLKSEQFRNLNVGFDIDEGFPSGNDTLVHIAYAEKSQWQFNITARGEASHASNLPQYTAGQRLHVVIDKLLAYRKSEYDRLANGEATIDEITSLNLVRLGGGTGNNIIPNEVWASFDMRIWLKPGWNYTDVEAMIMNITEEARLGNGPNNEVTVEFLAKSMESGRTTPNNSNIWWTVVQNTCQELNLTCPSLVFNGATDASYVRELNIPAFGINLFPNTPSTAHQDNEYINEHEFLRGIDRYTALIRNVANLPANLHP